ncbi:general secretion pathway protein GspN [Luteibacter aegosomatissinici]|uniref:general secretion pathway protein GspN n=1 Tax=Luteibacter aegosomatissinici TaxID=2911539 RepID=UPI001FF8E8EA|nr:general secretion pathway protein GspN [Luteibacter aegosomatissinici]UPG94933.1 general secretion pathway protein GspN [Luteibacter aegosomatissinici]
MNAAGQRRLTPILAGIAIALACTTAAFAVGVGRGVHWDDPNAPEPLPPVRAASMPAPSPLANFAETWQRPLFMADRKPVASTGGDDNAANIGDLELTGIIMTDGLHMALLRDRDKGTAVRVKEGAALQEGHWTLASLTPRSAVFDNGGQRRELTLKVAAPDPLANAKPGGPTPPGAQPPRPPQASADDGVRVVQPQGGGMTGPALPHPPASSGTRSPPPRQDDADLQRARIEALKQAVQKRRMEQQQEQQRQQDVR